MASEIDALNVSKLLNLARLCKSVWQHPANRERKFKAFFDLLKWQANKQFLSRDMLIDYHGLKFICFNDSHSSSAVIYYNGQPDFTEMQFMKSYLKPGDAYLDIGANIGTYSLYAASLVGDKGVVDAFEAGPETSDKLKKQITLNQLSQVNLHCVAVSDKNGEINFDLTADDCTAHISFDDGDNDGLRKIKTVRLDDYLNPVVNYAMGKMDIEGAEILALKGAENMLSQANPPVWQLELAGYSNRYGYRSDQVLDYLKEFDYHCAIYDSAENKINFIDKPWASGYQNILAIHQSANISLFS